MVNLLWCFLVNLNGFPNQEPTQNFLGTHLGTTLSMPLKHHYIQKNVYYLCLDTSFISSGRPAEYLVPIKYQLFLHMWSLPPFKLFILDYPAPLAIVRLLWPSNLGILVSWPPSVSSIGAKPQRNGFMITLEY